jgi:hypothetical protein
MWRAQRYLCGGPDHGRVGLDAAGADEVEAVWHGRASIAGIIGDPEWKNILIAARDKGVEELPSERTIQRWSTRDETSKLRP